MAINRAYDLYVRCPTCGMGYRPDLLDGDPNRVPEHFDQRTDCEIVPTVCWGSGLLLNPRRAVQAEKALPPR